MNYTACSLLIAVGLTATALGGQSPRPACPIDEALRDDSLVSFRDQMVGALHSRDFERLRLFIARDVDASEVGGLDEVIGPNAFRDKFELGDRESPYWRLFEEYLSQGGVLDETGAFCAPYFSCNVSSAEDITNFVITGVDVPAHSQPLSTSAVLARLSCTTVAAAGEALGNIVTAPDWVGVVLPKGQLAFVPAAAVASHDFYLRFKRENGRWFLVSIKGFD